ncbi:phage holin family protein, partial [Pseudonocardia xishanensis]|uniref:phage holin family protein n=1 Tax=Pseudonocardia xishanensis TaxID=630995 RepID=UPI0031E72842
MTAPRHRPVDEARHAAATTTGNRVTTESESVGDLVGNVTRDLSILMRQELALAKAELKQEAGRTGKAAGAFGGAGFAAWFVV